MTHRHATIVFSAAFPVFLFSVFTGCAPDHTDAACGEVDNLLDDHGTITGAAEALEMAADLADIANRGAGDIEDDLRLLSLQITSGDFDDTYIEAANRIEGRCS